MVDEAIAAMEELAIKRPDLYTTPMLKEIHRDQHGDVWTLVVGMDSKSGDVEIVSDTITQTP